MLWVLGGLIAWLVLALLIGLVLGTGIRVVRQRSAASDSTEVELPNFVHDPEAPVAPSRPRAILLPLVGVGLAAVAVFLLGTGFVLQWSGASGATAQALSVDAPLSAPRLYTAALFAAGAFAAVMGAGTRPGRRTWWMTTGVVGACIAAVPVASAAHLEAPDLLADVLGWTGALLICALLMAGILGVLWSLSRNERRDRRRVLGSLAVYGVAAAVGSAMSSVAIAAYGGASSWAVVAAFVQRSGEASAGVAFLIAVLTGVAPGLVLPADAPLRRADDVRALGLPVQRQAGPPTTP